MYTKSIRPSAKRKVQEEQSTKRDDQIARLRRPQTCDQSDLARDENVLAKWAEFCFFLFFWKVSKPCIKNFGKKLMKNEGLVLDDRSTTGEVQFLAVKISSLRSWECALPCIVMQWPERLLILPRKIACNYCWTFDLLCKFLDELGKFID